MPAFLPELALAISTRLAGDEPLLELLNGGDGTTYSIFNGYYPESAQTNSSPPYIVFKIGSWKSENTMNSRAWDITLVVTVHLRKRVSGEEAMATAYSILSRVEGDWEAHADRVPTYGLEYFKPTLSTSGYSMTPLLYESGDDEEDAEMLRYILTFTATVEKVKAT